MKGITLSLIFVTCFLFGCASYKPICDMRGVNKNQYDADLRECSQYAEQISAGESAAAGAGIGAGIGALVGLVVGIAFNVDDKAGLAAFGASIGGMKGAADAGTAAGQAQINIIRNCMAGRGYTVLQ